MIYNEYETGPVEPIYTIATVPSYDDNTALNGESSGSSSDIEIGSSDAAHVIPSAEALEYENKVNCSLETVGDFDLHF